MSTLQSSIIALQQRIVKGEQVSDEEIRAALASIRLSRSAVQTTTTSKKSAVTPMSDAQLNDLLGKI